MLTPERLLARFGSPLYVYDLAEVDRSVERLRAALPCGAVLHYSLKANPHPDVVARMRDHGCRAEVSSPGEVAAAIQAGLGAGDLLYTGPAKTQAEIAEALRADVDLFSVESGADLRRVSDVALAQGSVTRCLLRVNMPLAAKSAIRMTGAAAYFGVPLAEVLATPQRFADQPGVRVVGLHFFCLSNASEEGSLIDQALAAVEAAARVARATRRSPCVLDLGGGFAMPYARPGEAPVYREFASALETALDQRFPGWRSGQPLIAFESGRYLVGSAGRLICTATEWRKMGDQAFVLLDSGINHLGGMSGLGRLIPSAVPSGPGGVPFADGSTVTLAGPLCTPADVMSRQTKIDPATVPGPVVIPNVGAYGLTASLIGFLSRSAPVEVVLDGETVVSASQLRVVRAPLGRGVAT